MKIIKAISLAVTMIFTGIMIYVLPDTNTIPVHFDINGLPDRYGSKYELLLMPVTLILMICLMEFISVRFKKQVAIECEKRQQELNTNVKVMDILSTIISIFIFVINTAILYITYTMTFPNLGLPELDMMSVTGISMGLLFIAIANYMPKTRKNSNVGFRMPWTMYNDVTWSKSNRFASYVMILAGSVSIVVSLFVKGIIAVTISISAIILSIVIMTVYAYIVYRGEKKNGNEADN